MADTILLIALTTDSVADVRWGAVGATDCSFAASLDLSEEGGALAAMARDSLVVVLVPSRHVVLRQTAFQGKARQATPLALAYPHEDGLLTDAEQMHWVVLGKAQRDFSIAGVALTQMQSWLERLSTCGIRVDKMIPDVLALPLPGQCSAVRWRSQWLIRTGAWQGMPLPEAWGDCLPPPAPDWCLHRGGKVPPTWEGALIEEDPFWRLAEEAWHSKFNLLQGRFKPAARWPRLMPDKITCALLLLSGSLLASGLHHQLMAAQAERQIVALSQRLLPGQPLAALSEQAVREQVRRMQNALNAPQLFSLLPDAVEALSAWEPPQVQSLAFDAARDQLVVTLFRNDLPLPPPTHGDGLSISFDEGSTPNQAILTIGGER